MMFRRSCVCGSVRLAHCTGRGQTRDQFYWHVSDGEEAEQDTPGHAHNLSQPEISICRRPRVARVRQQNICGTSLEFWMDTIKHMFNTVLQFWYWLFYFNTQYFQIAYKASFLCSDNANSVKTPEEQLQNWTFFLLFIRLIFYKIFIIRKESIKTF